MPPAPENPAEPRSYSLRLALPQDAHEIARLSTELGYPANEPEMKDRLALLLSSPTELVVVAETKKGHLLGWIAASQRILLEYGARVEIVGLIVDQQARRLGLGRALIAAAEGWALEQGTPVISVHSNIVRPDSHPFYERLGYRREKTQHYYLKILRPPGPTAA